MAAGGRGSLGQHSFSLGKQPTSRAGQAREGQGTPTNLPPKGGCSPGGRVGGGGHLWVPAPTRPARPAGELRRWAKARGQLGHIPSSSNHQPNSFFLETFYLGLSYLYILEARHHTYNIGLRIRIISITESICF